MSSMFFFAFRQKRSMLLPEISIRQFAATIFSQTALAWLCKSIRNSGGINTYQVRSDYGLITCR